MAKRPKKAPETGPHIGYIPLGPDNQPFDPLGEQPHAWREVLQHEGREIVTPRGDWPFFVGTQLKHILGERLPNNWQEHVASIYQRYRVSRTREILGANENEVRKAIGEIEKAVLKLKNFLDLPKSEAAIFAAAWSRLDAIRHPWEEDTDKSLHQIIYPALSKLNSRIRTYAGLNGIVGFLSCWMR